MSSKMETIKKKFARLGAAAVSVSPCLPQKQPFLEYLPGNNNPDSHHSQGVMKFATQISPLLNYLLLI